MRSDKGTTINRAAAVTLGCSIALELYTSTCYYVITVNSIDTSVVHYTVNIPSHLDILVSTVWTSP